MKRFIFFFGLWTSILSLISAGTVNFVGLVPAEWIPLITKWSLNLVVMNTAIMTGIQGYPSAPDIRLPDGVKRALVLIGTMFLIGLGVTESKAADLAPVFKNPFAGPYDLGHCGGYYGINTIGTATGVNGDVAPGTQVVQGGIGATVGYGCPINVANGSFWFAEGLFDITNLNGNQVGLSLSGPASFTQRFGAGTPIQNMLSVFPGLSGSNAPAVPNLPTLPNGITAGPGSPYMFVALHEQDISAQLGLAQNREWLISGGVGLGIRYRLSNGVVADTFAEFKTQTNTLCIGPQPAGCAKLGSGAMVGFQLLY